jgi:23S rRNA (uracil1939-C5)-methyltransferase
MIESFGPAAAQAGAAARAQGLDVEAECADVAVALRAIAARREPFDAAVLNPPRRGTSPAVRDGLARVAPSLIAYVSCDPETLLRDLDHFARLGYRAAALRPFDMIPLTDEVETVALLRPDAPPPPRVLWEHPEAFVVDKGPYEPTMPQGEYPSSLLARARRLPEGREAVPVHRPDVNTSGIVLFARRPDQVARWSRVLAATTTQRVYLAAVRGVTPARGSITHDLRDNGKAHSALTRYRRLAIASGQSVLRVVVSAEHRHQIRRHLADAGHPVLGDDRYGHRPTNRYFEEKNALGRTFLHCVGLDFNDPETGARHSVEAAPAGDLRAVLARMGAPELQDRLQRQPL